MLTQLIIASHNAGKVREIDALLQPLNIAVSSASEHALPEPEETGTSFAANAALKAEAACSATGLACLADDSGLCVSALDDAPGIYSARWAGPGKDFTIAMERIRTELGDKAEGAEAYFICDLALALPGQETQHFEGRIYGTLTFPPRGQKGFGYDPIFVPNDHTLTFAEIAPEEKHAMSHRGRAFEKLYRYLSTQEEVA